METPQAFVVTGLPAQWHFLVAIFPPTMWWATHVAPLMKSKMADANPKALETMRFRLRHGVEHPFFFMPALTLAASLSTRHVPAQALVKVRDTTGRESESPSGGHQVYIIMLTHADQHSAIRVLGRHCAQLFHHQPILH